MIRNILTTKHYSQLISILLLALRFTVGVFMLTHGGPKFMKLIEGNLKFADPIGVGQELSLVLTVFAEFFCSLLLILGLVTRFAAIPLLITMFVALFIIHSEDPITEHYNILGYLAGYFALLILGAGKYSLDYKYWGKE